MDTSCLGYLTIRKPQPLLYSLQSAIWQPFLKRNNELFLGRYLTAERPGSPEKINDGGCLSHCLVTCGQMSPDHYVICRNGFPVVSGVTLLA